MISNYESVFFTKTELLPPSLLTYLSPQLQAMILPERVLRTLDFLRTLVGTPIIINDAKNKIKGIRANNEPKGAKESTHKGYQGRQGVDVSCADLPLLLELIKAHYKVLLIKRIENPAITMPKGYIHIEIELVGNVDGDLVIFTP